jgi:Tat protein secretion system quality control protein TatD with DNase activity
MQFLGKRILRRVTALADQKFAADLDAVVARAKQAGVERALVILSADQNLI